MIKEMKAKTFTQLVNLRKIVEDMGYKVKVPALKDNVLEIYPKDYKEETTNEQKLFAGV